MILIYIYTDGDSDKWIVNDYINFSFKKCFLFYIEKEEKSLNNFLKEIQNKLKPTKIKIEEFGSNSNSQYILSKKIPLYINSSNEINDSEKSDFSKMQEIAFSIYINKVEFFPQNINSSNSIINKFKLLLDNLSELSKSDKNFDKNEAKLIIDLTNCSLELYSLLYYLILKYKMDEKFDNLELILWDKLSNKPRTIPLFFLDSTSQLFLDLIASGTSTIKDLQEKYSKLKKTDKIVSQPFVSKYISNLIKLSLIKEDWIEGFKHFYLTSNGHIHYSPSLKNLKYEKESIIFESSKFNEIQTSELIQKLIISYYNKKIELVEQIFEELLNRNDLNQKDIQVLTERLKDFNDERLVKFFKNFLNVYPNSVEILTVLANYYFKANEFEKAFEFCQKAIKNDPNYSPVWEILGKLTLTRKK